MASLSPKRADYIEAVRFLHQNSPISDHLGITLDRIEPGFVRHISLGARNTRSRTDTCMPVFW